MSARNRARRAFPGMALVKRAIRASRKAEPFRPGPRHVWRRSSGEYPDSAQLVAAAEAKRARRRERNLVLVARGGIEAT